MLRSAIIAAAAFSVAVPTAALAEAADALAASGPVLAADGAAVAPIPALAAWSASQGAQADAYALAAYADGDSYVLDGTYGPVLPAAQDEGLGTGEKVAIGAGVIVGAALVVAVVGYVLIANRDWEN